jgi:uncharacterized protein (DUF1697 family)
MQYAVFLRSINVGSFNRIKMVDLRQMLVDGGFGRVETYLQSGNVLLESTLLAEEVEDSIELILQANSLKNAFAFARTKAQLDQLLVGDSFADYPVESHYQLAIFTKAQGLTVTPELKGANYVAQHGSDLLSVLPRVRTNINPNAIIESHWKTKSTGRFLNVVRDFNERLLG